MKHRILITTSILFLCITQTVTCRPSPSKNISKNIESVGFQKQEESEYELKIQNCYKDMDLNELCQRCEKVAQSVNNDVFAMCCSNDDNATEFCRNYVFYGVHQ
jgi:hypothetical protein